MSIFEKFKNELERAIRPNIKAAKANLISNLKREYPGIDTSFVDSEQELMELVFENIQVTDRRRRSLSMMQIIEALADAVDNVKEMEILITDLLEDIYYREIKSAITDYLRDND